MIFHFLVTRMLLLLLPMLLSLLFLMLILMLRCLLLDQEALVAEVGGADAVARACGGLGLGILAVGALTGI